MDALETIRARKSVRSYKQDQVPGKEQLEEIVWAAQNAPNAGAFAVTVVTDRALLNEIDEALYQSMINSEGFGKERASLPGYRPLYGAPACIVFSAAAGDAFGDINTAAAATQGSLAAVAQGLGSCYVMGPKMAYGLVDDLGAKLALPEGYVPLCGLLVGYTDDPERFYHKFLEQIPAVYI